MARRRQIYFEQTGQKITAQNSPKKEETEIRNEAKSQDSYAESYQSYQENSNYATREERRNEQSSEDFRNQRENSEVVPMVASRTVESSDRTARRSNQLTAKVQPLINRPKCNTGLIGVFGMNADILVDRTLYDIRNQDVVLFNRVDIANTGHDIYNLIAATIMNEIEKDDRYRVGYYRDSYIEYEAREILTYLQELYSDPSDEYMNYWESGLKRLYTISMRSQRNETFKKIIGKMQRFYSANTKFVFVICTSTNPLTIQTLEMIMKLISENVIFIIESLASRELQFNAINATMGGYEVGGNLFARYFTPANIVQADTLD